VAEHPDPGLRHGHCYRQHRRPRYGGVGRASDPIGISSMQLRAGETLLGPDTPIHDPRWRPSRRPALVDGFGHRRGREFLRGCSGRLRRQHRAGSNRPTRVWWRRVATHEPVCRRLDQPDGARCSARPGPLEALHGGRAVPFTGSARRHEHSGVAIGDGSGARRISAACVARRRRRECPRGKRGDYRAPALRSRAT
jgi:hypothetical protein